MLTHEERIEICKTCTKREFNPAIGIACSLTHQIADFEYECPTYEADSEKIEPITSGNMDGSIERVSMGTRFLNFLLDGVVLWIISTFFPFDYKVFLIRWPWDIELFALTITVVYYFLLEATTGKTIGKMITGCKVVTVKGETPSADKLLIRSLSRLIPFNALSFLFTDGNGWHDRISDTIVVKKDFNEEIHDEEILDRF